jgi:hypothetical protein
LVVIAILRINEMSLTRVASLRDLSPQAGRGHELHELETLTRRWRADLSL